jgi:hypothetical protein
MPERYVLIDSGWIELGDSWTYAEHRDVDTLNDAELMRFLATKIVAVELGGITSQQAFTEGWESLDLRIFNWLLSVSILERSRIGKLGESTLRSSLESFAKALAKVTTEATPDK